MHKSPEARRITIGATERDIELLKAWAAQHMTSVSAEAIRAIRERAAREEVRDRARA